MAEVDGESPGVGGTGPRSGCAKGRKHSSFDEDNNSPTSEASASTSKKIVEVACYPCRRRKSKCTGERPSCQCCIRKNTPCEYEHEEGLTRLGSLRYKLSEATVQAETLQFLFQQLRTRPDNEAACLLALLRIGVDIETLVEQLKTEPDELWSLEPNNSRLLPKLREQVALVARQHNS